MFLARDLPRILLPNRLFLVLCASAFILLYAMFTRCMEQGYRINMMESTKQTAKSFTENTSVNAFLHQACPSCCFLWNFV